MNSDLYYIYKLINGDFMENTITFDLNKDEAQDLLNALGETEGEGDEYTTINCMIETLEDYLRK
jgi:hypothetical protein